MEQYLDFGEEKRGASSKRSVGERVSRKVWLFNPYGPIPDEGWRDYRFAVIGKTLARQGFSVIWWTANFSHHFKRFRADTWEDRKVCEGFSVRLVPTTGYTSNISIARLAFELNYFRNVWHRARRGPRPDLIIAADPPQGVGLLGALLSERLRVPLLVDMIDKWPELFHLAFPRWAKPFSRLLLLPFYAARKHNLSRADAITTQCRTYLDLALQVAPVLRKRPHAVIYNGIDVHHFRSLLNGSRDWRKPSHEIWAIYAGTLGDNYDVQAVLDAGLKLAGSNICVVIAGSGPRQDNVVRFLEKHPSANLRYVGTLTHHDLVGLYQVCDVAICPYAPGSTVAIPDKAYDYMAARLPMVSSLTGEFADLLREEGAGVQYDAGNADSLTRALREMSTQQLERLQIGRRSADLAVRFDTERQYLKLTETVREVLK